MLSVNIPSSSCRIEDCGFAKARARSSSDNGARVKKIRLIFDLTSKESLSEIDNIFVGASDMIAAISKEEANAVTLSMSKRPPEVTVTLKDPTNKKQIFKMIAATCTAPQLRIARKAERVEMSIVVVGQLSKEELCQVDDYFKADCIGSIESVQTDIEETIAAPAKKKSKKQSKQVEVSDDEQLDELMQ